MILVKIRGLSVSNVGGCVVLLKGDQDARTLPIFIGFPEAQAIAMRIENVETPRPLTHDLLKNLLDCMEWRLKRVVINDLVEGTFYAVLVAEREGSETEVDCRPSDAIALAVRCGAPIYVAKKVMEQAGVEVEGDESAPSKPEAPAAGAAAERESGLSQLKAQLDQAVRQERYEDAARLRDAIKKLDDSHAKN
jgi:bifunctional DNase/RNase